MPAKTDVVAARMNAEIVERAREVLEEMGLTVSIAIRSMLSIAAARGERPFAAKLPPDHWMIVDSDAQTIVRARIDPAVKEKAADVLGMTMSEAVHFLIWRIGYERALPFRFKLPET